MNPEPPAALTESAVLVQVPAAEPAITSTTLAILAGAVASVTAFGCQFPAAAWFGTDVLWLAPRPDEPFLALIRAVSAAFPGYLPFGGFHSEVIPHLTIGNRPAGGSAELRTAEAEVVPALPVAARISQVHLMAGSTAPAAGACWPSYRWEHPDSG